MHHPLGQLLVQGQAWVTSETSQLFLTYQCPCSTLLTLNVVLLYLMVWSQGSPTCGDSPQLAHDTSCTRYPPDSNNQCPPMSTRPSAPTGQQDAQQPYIDQFTRVLGDVGWCFLMSWSSLHTCPPLPLINRTEKHQLGI